MIAIRKKNKLFHGFGEYWALPLVAVVAFLLFLVCCLLVINNAIYQQSEGYNTGKNLLLGYSFLKKRLDHNRQHLLTLKDNLLQGKLDTDKFKEFSLDYLETHPELINVIWIDSSNAVIASTRSAEDPFSTEDELKFDEPRRAASLAKEHMEHKYTKIFVLRNRVRVFEIIIPVCNQQKHLGMFIGVYSCKSLEKIVDRLMDLHIMQIKLKNVDPNAEDASGGLPNPHIGIELKQLQNRINWVYYGLFGLAFVLVCGIVFCLLRLQGLLVRAKTVKYEGVEYYDNSRLVLQRVSDGIIFVTTDEHVVDLNQAAEKMLGLSSDDVSGRKLDAVLHLFDSETGKPWQSVGEKLIDKMLFGDLRFQNAVMRNGEGIKFNVSAGAFALGDKEGTVVIIRKQENNSTGGDSAGIVNKLERVAELAKLGLWEFVLLNGKEAHVVVKHSPFEMPGQHGKDEFSLTFSQWLKLIHPEDFSPARRRFRDFMQDTELDNFHDEVRLADENGHWHYVEIIGQVVERDSENENLVLEGFIQDMTSLKNYHEDIENAKAAVEAANLAKSTFLANMSHEIRTPLNAIIGFSSFLAELDLSEESAQYAKIIRSSGNLLLDRFNDILDFSKLESGKIDIHLRPCNIRELLEDVYLVQKFDSDKKNLSLEIDVPDVFPLMMLDAARLRQAVLNLVGNAIKFTSKGFVRISAQTTMGENNYCCLNIMVEDSGIGINEEARQRIFKEFEQEDQHEDRAFGGAGLGLTIASRLAALMGGCLNMESTPGHGSTFTIVLPRVEITEFSNSQHQESRQAVLPTQEALRDLPVPDNKIVCEAEQRFRCRLAELQQSFSVSEVNNLSLEIAAFAEDEKSPALQKIAEMLQQAAIYFDFSALEQTIEYFDDIMKSK